MSAPEPRALPYTREDIKHRLQHRVRDLLAELGFSLRDIRRDGTLWPLNPMRGDRKPGSFCIWTEGDKAGAFVDFAVKGPGGSGSIFDLIGGVKRHAEWIDTYWWALGWLNLDRGRVRTKAEDVEARERAERDRLALEAKRTVDEEAKSARLFSWWVTLPKLKGSIAETYLREARGIALDRLPRLPEAIRFCPALDHIDQATGEVTAWPAMVTAMTRGAKVTGLHRTWLKPDGSGKAPVDKPKMMIGPCRGAAMRLSNGARDIPVTTAAEKGYFCPLIVGEGIETTLTAATAQPGYRAWAAGSLSGFASLEWPACAEAVILLGENDESPVAAQAFERARLHWAGMAKGRPFLAVFPPKGAGDFNEWVVG